MADAINWPADAQNGVWRRNQAPAYGQALDALTEHGSAAGRACRMNCGGKHANVHFAPRARVKGNASRRRGDEGTRGRGTRAESRRGSRADAGTDEAPRGRRYTPSRQVKG